jgi:hypothetical protein
METKLSKLKKFMAAGDYRASLRLVATFFELGKQKEAITRAWAAMVNPGLYRQMGECPEHLIEAGINAIRNRYKIV